MRVLLSNDDGVHALGLHVLAKELRKMADVWVVAPLEEKSTTGHSLTIHKPLRLVELGHRFYGVNGSPADCVYLGLRHFFKKKADFVISGINRGANLGQDVYYSGTVSAAREACMERVRGFAVSLAIDFSKSQPESELHYATAARVAAKVVRRLGDARIPDHTLININVPDLPLAKLKGVRVARQGFRFYSGGIVRRIDHRGKDYYWIGGRYQGFRKEAGTDCLAVDEGFASVTPVRLDATDDAYLGSLEETFGTG